MLECQSLEEAEWEEERKEKELHLMEVEEECIKEMDKGELLILRRLLVAKRRQIMKNKGKTSSTHGAPYTAVCALS